MCCNIWIKSESHSCSEIYSKLDFISKHVYDMYKVCLSHFQVSGTRFKKKHTHRFLTRVCVVCASLNLNSQNIL